MVVINGVGPWWFPSFIRNFLTNLSMIFFKTASWEKHDEGYVLGKPDRQTCDKKFLSAMIYDISNLNSVSKMFIATFLSWFFWTTVRVFGWLSYNRK